MRFPDRISLAFIQHSLFNAKRQACDSSRHTLIKLLFTNSCCWVLPQLLDLQPVNLQLTHPKGETTVQTDSPLTAHDKALKGAI